MGDRGIPQDLAAHERLLPATPTCGSTPRARRFWVKYHFKTDQGIDFLTQDEADRLAGEDGDYHQRDLYEAIERGDYPSWTLKMQIMPFEEAKTYRFNPFDLTKVWPHGDYPLIEVGTLTLDRNVTDYHTEIEQAAFEPNNLVPGIGLSPDKMLLARGFSYADAHRARLGRQLQADPGQRAEGAGAQLQQGRGDAGRQRVRPGVRARTPRAARRPTPSTTGRSGWHADGEMVRAAYTLRERRRRLGPGRHPGPRGPGRRRPRPAGQQHRRPPAQRRDRAGAAARLRVLAQRRQGPRRRDRGRRPRQAILIPPHEPGASPQAPGSDALARRPENVSGGR